MDIGHQANEFVNSKIKDSVTGYKVNVKHADLTLKEQEHSEYLWMLIQKDIRGYSRSTKPKLNLVHNIINDLEASLDLGAGNCGEKGKLEWLFCVLIKRISAKVDLMISKPKKYETKDENISNDTHVFLVIGRKDGSDENDYSTWGRDAVVCDPHNPMVKHRVYLAEDIPQKLPSFYYRRICKPNEFLTKPQISSIRSFTKGFDEGNYNIKIVNLPFYSLVRRKITNAFTFSELEHQLSYLPLKSDITLTVKSTYVNKTPKNSHSRVPLSWNQDIWRLEKPLKKFHEKLEQGHAITVEARQIRERAYRFIKDYKFYYEIWLEQKKYLQNVHLSTKTIAAACVTIRQLKDQMSAFLLYPKDKYIRSLLN